MMIHTAHLPATDGLFIYLNILSKQ